MPVVLFTLWVIFNTGLNWEVAVTGVLVTAFVYRFMCKHMGYRFQYDLAIIRKFPLGLHFAAALIWEALLSNIEVTKFVFNKNMEIKPQLVFFETNLKTDAARVALANSITLTPGTITVSEEEGVFGVHCLNSHMSEGLDSSALVSVLAKMEGNSASNNNGEAATAKVNVNEKDKIEINEGTMEKEEKNTHD